MEFSEWRNLMQNLKGDWKELWRTRFNDEVRAEGIATKSFDRLFIDKGEVIIATRDYKPPSFHEVLEAYIPRHIVNNLNPHPSQGGWGKFIREHILKQKKGRSTSSCRKCRIEGNTQKKNDPKFRNSRFKRLKKSGKRWKPVSL